MKKLDSCEQIYTIRKLYQNRNDPELRGFNPEHRSKKKGELWTFIYQPAYEKAEVISTEPKPSRNADESIMPDSGQSGKFPDHSN